LTLVKLAEDRRMQREPPIARIPAPTIRLTGWPMVACGQILYRAGTGILPAPHGGNFLFASR
jgi:hypothetical protein